MQPELMPWKAPSAGQARDDGARLRHRDPLISRFGSRTRSGLQTSHASGPRRAGSTWPAVLDLFARRVVGWFMKVERDASLVMNALLMAVCRRDKADDLLHQS